MNEPSWIEVPDQDASLRALSWGPEDGPIAMCLHGFPDTAYGWRKVAPVLVEAGWRVVAPFTRGYAPSSTSAQGSYHVGALMADALRVLEAAGPTGRDVLIGHDWGAFTGAGLAAMPNSPFVRAVIMSVPPAATFRGRIPNAGRLIARLPRQLVRSWYIMFFQLPLFPERSAQWIVPRLWRTWSHSYDATTDVALVLDAIGCPENWRAAVGYYRAIIRGGKPPPRYATPIGCRGSSCPHCTCMVPMTVAPLRITRGGWNPHGPPVAGRRSSNAPGTSCTWNDPTRSPGSSSTSSEIQR